MDNVTKLVTAIFGGILFLAIVSVIVSRKSQAPQAIQAFSSGIANIVGAAVSPSAVNNGNNGTNMYSDPSSTNGVVGLGNMLNSIQDFNSALNSFLPKF